MDLTIKPANEIEVKSSNDMKKELLKNTEETENPHEDKLKDAPKPKGMSDIFNTASKKVWKRYKNKGKY